MTSDAFPSEGLSSLYSYIIYARGFCVVDSAP